LKRNGKERQTEDEISRFDGVGKDWERDCRGWDHVRRKKGSRKRQGGRNKKVVAPRLIRGRENPGGSKERQSMERQTQARHKNNKYGWGESQ